jgi:DNA gyrase subunit A
MAEFAEAEEFILTVCANGYGKRTSAYEYRRTNRGGQGITNIDNLERNGPVVASFPAHDGEQLMLVTDQAKLIRMTVGDTRVIGRNSAGRPPVQRRRGRACRLRRADRREEEAHQTDGLPSWSAPTRSAPTTPRTTRSACCTPRCAGSAR